MRPIAVLDVREGREQEIFGPIVLPDGPTCFSLLFQAPDDYIGWALDTWVSLDYGRTWHYSGGCARMSPTVRGYRGLRSTGLSFSCLPPGRGRLFRAVITSAIPCGAMQGEFAVGQHRLPIQTPIHHSVAFDNATTAVQNNTTNLTTGLFTISGTERAGVLCLAVDQSATPFPVTATSIGGQSAGTTALSGTDTGTTGGFNRTAMFGVAAPATGSQTGSITWTNAADAALGVITATGVDQTTPFSNGTFASGQSVSVTSATNDMTLAFCGSNGSSLTTSTQTERFNSTIVTFDVAGSTGNGAASNTHTWTGGTVPLASGVNLRAVSVAVADLTGAFIMA